jgi:ABC-type phosphate transport system permease subunit
MHAASISIQIDQTNVCPSKKISARMFEAFFLAIVYVLFFFLFLFFFCLLFSFTSFPKNKFQNIFLSPTIIFLKTEWQKVLNTNASRFPKKIQGNRQMYILIIVFFHKKKMTTIPLN